MLATGNLTAVIKSIDAC